MEMLLEEKGIWAVGVMLAYFIMTFMMEWMWLYGVKVIVDEGICNELRTELSKNTVYNIAHCCLDCWTLWHLVFFFFPSPTLPDV